MREADYDRFLAALSGMSEFYRHPLSAVQIAIYWRSLADLSVEAFEASLYAHTNNTERGAFMPKPSDIRKALETAAKADGHPEPDEAWSIAIQARDEGSSVVWTDEIADAFLVAAMPLLAERDKVAARKAFIDRYTRNVVGARTAGKRATWLASLGTDQSTRVRAIDQAVAMGRITQEHAEKLLPTPTGPINVRALEHNAAKTTDPEGARRQIDQLTAMLRLKVTAKGR